MLYEEEDLQAAAENRLRNLMWTVSGDYGLDTKLDVKSYEKSRYISMYDAVKQGAFARFYDKNEFGMYLVRKVWLGADEQQLTDLAQLCVDAASYRKIASERPGVPEIREKAFADLLEYSFRRMSETLTGRLKIAFLREELDQDAEAPKQLRESLQKILALENAQNTMEIIRAADDLYNTLIDRGFEKEHGSLESVLAVPMEDLRSSGWKDFLKEDIREDQPDVYFEKMNQAVLSMEEEPDEEQEQQKKAKSKVVMIDEEAAEKMYSYMELNFGRSYLSENEQEQKNRRLCRGAHAGCRLYFTDGILADPVLCNAQYVNAKRHAEKNRVYFNNNRHMLARNIGQLADELKRSLNRRSEPEQQAAYSGRLVPRLLWQVGRKEEPGRLFERTLRRNSAEFAVDILIDASGSQRDCQKDVALQAFILAEALSINHIPVQITGFCSFWDYTVLQRFRSYDDPRSENRRLLNYSTTANNRDGLAIRAVGDSLLQRLEEGKILIVLSDGKPNDRNVNRPMSRNPRTYAGRYAVQDTAYEVRKLRGSGVCVLGIFTGKEQELMAEKTIFGKDFTYIRNISGFSRVAAGYLRRLIDEDSADFQ